jgi:type IV secretory pathway protease TraF
MRKLVALVVIAFVASSILFGHRLIVNRTHSLPVGLYYWSDSPIKKGSIVLFKPDQSMGPEQVGFDRCHCRSENPVKSPV